MSKKDKILFIVNPISGTGKQKNIEHLINSAIDNSKFEVNIKYTEFAGHAQTIVKNEHPHFDIIVAVGGDGSVHEVGTSLINTNTTLGIIPAGSGNGLARHLKIPMNITKALSFINSISSSNYKKIDTIKLNDDYFLGTAGIGFDAHIGWKFATAPKRGFWSYIKITFKEFFSYQEQSYQLTVDDKKHELTALLITIANSNQYGNNAFISPNSKLDDGYFRVIALKKFPLFYAPLLVYQLFTKKITQSRFITELKGKKLTFSPPSPEMHLDGEPIRIEKEINIEVLPQSLNIISNE
ncbi:MAG: YegS/Rv2252/BmrU family lipid kinase [Flavobacteriales bacterium]|nr:YegS/Rv2252/BmrU family lipid kinase [Flavobacteriales bacterium]